MPSDNPVLIDSSVWIEYLSKRDSALSGTVDNLLENAQVVCCSLILAELVQGAKSRKEISQLKDFFKPLPWIESGDRHWQEAGELSFRLKRTGKTVSLTDCYIAVLAREGGASILTLDKDFRYIADAGGCFLHSPIPKVGSFQ